MRGGEGLEAEGWGLVKVRGIEGALEETWGPPCHRIWFVFMFVLALMVTLLVWHCRSEDDFILTVVGEAALHRGMERIQEVQNACMDGDDG